MNEFILSFAEEGHVFSIWFAGLCFFCWLNYIFPHFTEHTGGMVGLAINDPYLKEHVDVQMNL